MGWSFSFVTSKSIRPCDRISRKTSRSTKFKWNVENVSSIRSSETSNRFCASRSWFLAFLRAIVNAFAQSRCGNPWADFFNVCTLHCFRPTWRVAVCDFQRKNKIHFGKTSRMSVVFVRLERRWTAIDRLCGMCHKERNPLDTQRFDIVVIKSISLNKYK